jgi:hypothetical protein
VGADLPELSGMGSVQGSDLPFWGACLLRKAREVLAALTMDAQQNAGSRLSRKCLVRLRQALARPRRAAPTNPPWASFVYRLWVANAPLHGVILALGANGAECVARPFSVSQPSLPRVVHRWPRKSRTPWARGPHSIQPRCSAHYRWTSMGAIAKFGHSRSQFAFVDPGRGRNHAWNQSLRG